MRKFLHWLFAVRATPIGIPKKVPWWCADPKHQPYYKEAAYDAHMLEVHGTDVRHSYQVKTRT